MDKSVLARPDLVDVEEKPAVASDSPCDPVTNKFSCGWCGRSYLNQVHLITHQFYDCNITARLPCHLCGLKFSSRDVLKGHMEKCMNKSLLKSKPQY